jgi:hypothetical protein
MRNVGNEHATTAIEAPGAVAAVFALALLAGGFGVANGCGKHEEPALQGAPKGDNQSLPSVVNHVPSSGPQINP